MKNLTTLLLTLLVLGGCATLEVIDPFQGIEQEEWKLLNVDAMKPGNSTLVRKSGNDLVMNTYSESGEVGISKIYYYVDNQNYTIKLKAADRFNFAQGALNGIWYKYNSRSFCGLLLGTGIKGRPASKEIDYNIAHTGTNEVKFTCWKPGEELRQRQLYVLKINKEKIFVEAMDSKMKQTEWVCA